MFTISLADNHRGKRCQSGFTLIELLVVVAIITLLISIMVPSLSKARDSAKSAVCKSNLHQIATGFHEYLANSAGFGRPGSAYTYGDTYYTWFYSKVIDSLHPDKPTYSPGGLLGLTSGKVIYCPTLTDPALPGQYDIPQSAYCPNGSFPSTFNTLNVENSSETMTWADAATVGVLTGTLNWPTYSLDKPSGNTPEFHGRHGKLGNVSWYDGHVTSEQPFIQTQGLSAGFNPTSLAKFNIGQLTPLPLTMSQIQFQGSPRRDYYFWVDKTGQR